jgi:hypothetical protein
MKTLKLLSAQSCQIFMGSKDALPKMQFLGAMKKVASLGAFIQNAKVAETPQRFGRHRSKIGPNPNILAYSKNP